MVYYEFFHHILPRTINKKNIQISSIFINTFLFEIHPRGQVFTMVLINLGINSVVIEFINPIMKLPTPISVGWISVG